MGKNFGMVVLIAAVSCLFPLSGQASEKYRGKAKEKVREFHQQNKEEKKAFHESLKDMTVEEKAIAIKEYRQQEHQERIDFLKKMHEEKMNHLKEKLGNSDKMSDQQKKEALAREENEYREKLKDIEKHHAHRGSQVSAIAKDPNLTPEQKKQALHDLHEKFKSENQQWKEKHREEMKAKGHGFKKHMKAEKP